MNFPTNRHTLALIAAACMVAPASLAQHNDPPIFADGPWEDLMEQSERDNTLLIAMVTADWSDPCNMMRNLTLRDGRVEDWFDRNAVITSMYDGDPESEAIYEQWAIQALPTFVAFHKGREVDRIIGGQAPEVFLTWLDSVENATNATPLVEGFGVNAEYNSPNELAADLLRQIESGQDEEASENAVWLWKHLTLESGSKPDLVRIAMVPALRQLASRHEPTKTAFESMRQKIAERALTGRGANPARIADFISISRIIDDSDTAITWYERGVKDPTTRAFFGTARHEIAELLNDVGRSDEVTTTIPSPAGAASGVERRLLAGVEKNDPSRPIRVEATKRLMGLYKTIAASQNRQGDVERINRMLDGLG